MTPPASPLTGIALIFFKNFLNRRNPFQGIAQSYHNIYLQQQINELAEIMNQTYRVVERIEQGQKDDRIGLLLLDEIR